MAKPKKWVRNISLTVPARINPRLGSGNWKKQKDSAKQAKANAFAASQVILAFDKIKLTSDFS